MAYSLKQAAEATARTKPTILRAIQTGKISAKKTKMGEWEIEPAELHLVYPPVASSVTRTDTQKEEEAVEFLLLRQELAAEKHWLNTLHRERERERREKERQLTALLVDQRTIGAEEGARPSSHSRWFSRLRALLKS